MSMGASSSQEIFYAFSGLGAHTCGWSSSFPCMSIMFRLDDLQASLSLWAFSEGFSIAIRVLRSMA